MSKDPAKDVEPATPGYDAFASPKPDDLELQDGVTKPIRGVSIPMLLMISFPRLAIQMAWSAQWAALGPYLGTMLPKYAVQLTQIIGPATGILVAPAVGVFSDRSTNSWGRRRPFMIYATITSVICYTAMGYTREIGEALGDKGEEDGNRTWTAVFTVIFYAWMDITINVVQTPVFLIIADFAGDRQTMGASIGQGWSTLGSILVAGYIEFFGAAHLSLHWFLFMLSLLLVITVTVASFAAREEALPKDSRQDATAWAQIKSAFSAIVEGLKMLPGPLIVYCFVFFCVEYGYTAYNGNKGQFFGLEVYDGEAENADDCDPDCTEAQDDYNDGVRIAGGRTDLFFNLVGYAFSWAIPFLVLKFGAKWVLICSLLPQSLLMVMAFCSVVAIDVIIVVLTTLSQTIVFALLVPLIIHVMGEDIDIGMYVGALNSAQCFGQLLNFAIGTGLVETSMGYKLPVFIGGAMSLLGVVVAIFLLKIKMHSL